MQKGSKAARGQFGECFEKERQAGRKGKVLCPINNPPNPPPPPLACLPVVCVYRGSRGWFWPGRQAGQACMGWVDITARPRPEGCNREKGRGEKGRRGEAGPLPSNVWGGEDGSCLCALCMPTLLGGEVRTTCFFFVLSRSLFPVWNFDIAYL